MCETLYLQAYIWYCMGCNDRFLNCCAHVDFHRDQYLQIIVQIKDALNTIRSWIYEYKIFITIPGFSLLLGMALIKHIPEYLDKSKENQGVMGSALENALQKAFEEHCVKRHSIRNKMPIFIQREKTHIFPWNDKEGYIPLVYDKKRFYAGVVADLGNYTHAIGHKPSCRGPKEYRLIGFRQHKCKTVIAGGEEGEFPIRMVQCINCGEEFSLLPGFLQREKHFDIDLIGQVFQNIVLFSQSIQAALENLKIGQRWIKSKQTITNWLRWIGILHPVLILTRPRGKRGSGYLQEGGGFEKEPNPGCR